MICGFRIEKLANDYAQVTLQTPTPVLAQPGHYVTINDSFSCYVMGNAQGLDMIVSPRVAKMLASEKQLTLSALKGEPLAPPLKTQLSLLMVQNEGIGAAIFYLKKYRKLFHGLVLLGSDGHFPFVPCPSRMMIAHLPPDVFAALPLFEDWGVPNRLASLIEQPGVFHGHVHTLANIWLAHQKQAAPQTMVINSL